MTVPAPRRRRTGLLAVLALLAAGAGGGAYAVRESGQGGPGAESAGPGALRAGGGAVQAVELPSLTPTRGADGSDEELVAVAARGDVVVAVGTATTGGRTLPVFLRSADAGATWQAATTTAPPLVGDSPASVAYGAAGVVAFGTGPGGTAVWTSSDGTSWQRQPEDRSAFLPDDDVNQVRATPQGFLAVGDETLEDRDTRGVLWSSADGVRWTRRTAASLGVQALRRGSSAVAVAVSGRTVVVGADEDDPAGADVKDSVAFWVSTDGGTRFARASTPLDLGAADGDRAYLQAVVARPGGFTAVGAGSADGDDDDGGGYDPVVLESADGRAWSQVDDLAISRTGDSSHRDATVTATGAVVAVGTSDDDALVTGERAGTWQRLDADVVALTAPGPQRLLGIAATRTGTVAVGVDSSRGDDDALLVRTTGTGPSTPVPLPVLDALAAASASASALTVTADGLVAGGTSASDGALWASADGRRWQVLRQAGGIADGLQPESVYAVAGRPDGRGVVAAGIVDEPLGSRALLLSSSDGRTFGPTGPSTLQRGTGVRADRQLFGAARTADVSVVVGEADDGRAGASAYALWSLDGRTWAAAAPAGLAGSAGSSRAMYDVASGPGRLVAVGYTERGLEAPYGPAAWTSSDGRAWSVVALPVPSGARGASMGDVAWTGTRWVALGRADRGQDDEVLAWTSVDGRRWSGPVALPLPEGRDAFATDVVATPDGRLVAVGGSSPVGGAEGDQDALVWTSADGTAWEVVDLPGSVDRGPGTQRLDAAVVHEGKLVALGPHLTAAGVRTLVVRLPLSRLPGGRRA